jgi:ribokinase
MCDVVVVGSLNMDLVVKAERLPNAGETILGQDFRTIPGGKGANQAASIARLGNSVAMVGRVVCDVFGHRLLDNLSTFGVHTSHIRLDETVSTGTATIIIDASGENRIIVVAGANARVYPNDIDAVVNLIQQAKLLVLQFEIPIETVSYAVEVAHRHHVRIVLNPAPACAVPDSFLAQIDYLVLNETEATFLSGFPVIDIPTASHAAATLRAKGAKVVVLTLGEKGALVATNEEIFHIPTRRVDVVDTTAAGDAFIGGLVSGLVKNNSLIDSVCLANATGTCAVTRYGAQTSLPTLEEAHAFLSPATIYLDERDQLKEEQD